MADPNAQNTAHDLYPSEADLPEPHEIEVGIDALQHEEVKEGDVIEFTSLAKSPEEYAKMKGLHVKFPNPNPDPNDPDSYFIDGRLVDWSDDKHFRVVGFVGKALITTTFEAEKLYKIKGNERLKGAVDFAREHESELADTRSEIHNMLSVLEQDKAA